MYLSPALSGYVTIFMLICHNFREHFTPSSSGLVTIYIFCPHFHVDVVSCPCGFVTISMWICHCLHVYFSLSSCRFFTRFIWICQKLFVVLSEVAYGNVKSRRGIERLKAQYMCCKIASICPTQQKIFFPLLLVGQNITQ